MIKLTKTCPISNVEHTMELPLTIDEYRNGKKVHKEGLVIQKAFPQLNANEHEFLLTGIHPDAWDAMFEEDEDEELECDKCGSSGIVYECSKCNKFFCEEHLKSYEDTCTDCD